MEMKERKSFPYVVAIKRNENATNESLRSAKRQ